MTEKDYKELEHYRTIFGTGDIATRAYRSCVKIVEQQVTYLDNFKISEKISAATKDDASYTRAEDMWENLPDMISKLHKLKNELGIEYVEKEEESIPVSPQSIGRKAITSY